MTAVAADAAFAASRRRRSVAHNPALLEVESR